MNRITALQTAAAIFGLAVSDLSAISEADYLGKYPFAVGHHPGDFTVHPSGRYRVFTRFGIRECDLEAGDVRVLAFFDGKKLIRSYSLKQLFPDPESWRFHPATGVFLWLMFNPKLNGFHGQDYTVTTDSGIWTFHIPTGEPLETPADP